MEPRWGASGKRIECTIDISFLTEEEAGPEVIELMVDDNKFGKKSVVRVVDTTGKARLRSGFDSMKVSGGGYRVDLGGKKGGGAVGGISSSSSTLRFYIGVDGTLGGDGASSYGDVSIPEGRLYFSLPCFPMGGGLGQLSTKEGIVTVRQVGWNTGWRRKESRILGVFRVKKIEDARRKDKF